MKIPVKGHSGLYRDESSNAIINENDNEYQEYLRLKELKLSEKAEIDSLKGEIDNLKRMIKNLLDEKL